LQSRLAEVEELEKALLEMKQLVQGKIKKLDHAPPVNSRWYALTS
jgi:hypothetical protein